MAFAGLNRNLSVLIRHCAAFSFITALPALAQDPGFDWSWEKDAPPPAAKEEPKAGDDGFKWSWDGGKTAEDPAAPAKSAAGGQVRDDGAYQKLLKENLDLRRKIAEALKDEELARNESTRMATEIKDMEQKLSESVQIIKTLKSTQDGAMSPDEINELEVRLSKAEKAREMLEGELDRLKKLRDDDKASATSKVNETSDLFQERERENVLLKKRLTEIESERRRLAKEREDLAAEAEKAKRELKEISEKAVAAARQGAEYKKIVAKLPDIEEQVAVLREDVEEKAEKLSAREQQLEALKVELERREHRLAKAQKMTELLEKARAEVQQVNNKEKLDMHYNMAVIYYKEGRTKDAEAEYLKALRIDPADADIHYNLGILYDQDLKKESKAAMHYRRYLTLRPNASDADQVRNWIMELEMSN